MPPPVLGALALVQPDDPAAALLLALVAGRVAAVAWARRTGVDPDAAGGLSMVTWTA